MANDPRHNLRNRSNNNKSAVQPIRKSSTTFPKSSSVTTTSKSSITTTNTRLSTSASTSTVPRLSTTTAQNQNLSDSVRSLESRLSALEALVSQLTSENSDLRQTVTNLQTEVTLCKNQAEHHQTSTTAITTPESNILLDQQDLNSNIVIRGVDAKIDTPESDLIAVYEGIRAHLDITDVADLAPVSVTVLPSNPTKNNSSSRPIRVQLQSAAAKTKFLQIRRVKKDIFQSDIGINNASRRPILISEQLTRSNQELLFQARSLREQNNFKFVWSTNGQILARHKQNTKVIRIIDSAHVNHLRSALNLPTLSEYGRLCTSTTGQHDSNNT